MMFRVILTITFMIVHAHATVSQHRETIERVRQYLEEMDTVSQSDTLSSARTNELENSNKIGLGYNLLAGSPVCYSGSCQMTEFMHPVFKLNYASVAPGSCTSKFVPDYVHLDCLPSTSISVRSETIATMEQLKESITNRIETSVGVSYSLFSFSYAFSKETRYMIDNIVQHDTTVVYTTALISTVKLSLFEPMMQLSDSFRYVIENMPCCDSEDADIEEYVKDFIFGYFGFTYVSRILLGGIAQEKINIDRHGYQQMVNRGVNINHQAQLSFQFKFGMKPSVSFESKEDETTYKSFISQIQSNDATTLGGDSSLTNIYDWSKTVSSNPVIVEFAIRDIFRLLTPYYFPEDPLITKKLTLIRLILDKYLNENSNYCYGDCGGNNGSRGTCVSTGHFGFGECQCKPQWSGPDCSIPVTTTNKILGGTICGFDRSFIRVNCEGLAPYAEGCPPGWLQKNWPTDLTVCYKNGTSLAKPMVGTLCGLYVYEPNIQFFDTLSCNSVYVNAPSSITNCPPLYRRVAGIRTQSVAHQNTVCASQNAELDLPGTFCGMQIEYTVDGPSCDGYNPGLRQCPPTYTSHRTMFNNMGFIFCVKS